MLVPRWVIMPFWPNYNISPTSEIRGFPFLSYILGWGRMRSLKFNQIPSHKFCFHIGCLAICDPEIPMSRLATTNCPGCWLVFEPTILLWFKTTVDKPKTRGLSEWNQVSRDRHSGFVELLSSYKTSSGSWLKQSNPLCSNVTILEYVAQVSQAYKINKQKSDTIHVVPPLYPGKRGTNFNTRVHHLTKKIEPGWCLMNGSRFHHNDAYQKHPTTTKQNKKKQFLK